MALIVFMSLAGHMLHRPISILQLRLSLSGKLTNGTNKAAGRLVRYVIGGAQVLTVQNELHKMFPAKKPMVISALAFVCVGIGTGVGYLAGGILRAAR